MSSAATPPPHQRAEPPLKLSEIQGRGRSLIASRPIKPGEILLSDTPLLVYPSFPPSSSFCSHCFRSLHSNSKPSYFPCPSSCSPISLLCSPHCLTYHSLYLCQTLARLPPLNPDLLTQAHFLLAAYNLASTSPSDFRCLLSLEGIESNSPEAEVLHSLIAPAGFSLEFTVALLAKDKRNAFGLMEPFREEAGGERRVRAYGIYPNASFFNHDCLPNACRFDYIEKDGDGNMEIVVRAVHDIPEGREVCLSYFPVNWGYQERQRRLVEDYGFRCECDRCQVERNWKDKDDEEVVEGMEEEEGDGEEGIEGMEEEDGDGDFPHAYFFVRYLCDRENCGGTLAPLPPSPQGFPSDIMECNVCGRLRKEEDADGDGVMIDDE